MNCDWINEIQGKTISILDMIITNEGNQLRLLCRIFFNNKTFCITFYNVSRLRMGIISAPFEIHGLEIINHAKSGWEQESVYEIRDFEDECINFFCKCFDNTGDGLREPS